VEHQTRLGSSVTRHTAPQQARPFHGTDSLSFAAASDMTIARATRANLLVAGPDHLVSNVVNLVAPETRSDVTIQARDGRLQLPPAASRPATVVIRDVDELSAVEQRRLLEWLDAAHTRTQVISTSSVPLLPRVEERRFNETLFYRLNTIYIDLFE
jgi:hypothetical protein